MQAFEKNDFLKHRTTLNCPTINEIYSAYTNLSPAGQVEVSCALTELPATLHALEAAGFFGMTIIAGPKLARGVKIIAYKGKDAACYDSGKAASYRGGALAVLDDDHHLLFGDTRICEKTAQIYSLPVYKKWLKVSSGNSELISRLESNPEPFDCDTFEADVARLADSIPESVPDEQPSSVILYPGPFKILILQDGTIIRRGVPAKLSKGLARELVKSDACVLPESKVGRHAKTAGNFKQAYKKQGVLCLLETADTDIVLDGQSLADLAALDDTPEEMKQRLLKMIDARAEYFIITGSDARNLDGCCPSDGVKAANLLVEAGVLQVVRSENAPDACPVNIYAFAGEIRSHENKPEFRIEQPFREKIKSYIRNNKPATPAWMPILRWSLLLFVLFSLGVMVANVVTGDRAVQSESEMEFVDALDLPFQTGVAVLLFHRSQRCAFCINMEAHSREALKDSFSGELQAGSLAFRLIDMEQPHYKSLAQKFGLFTSSIVLIELREQKIARWKVFMDAWDLTGRRQEFMQKFKTALQNFKLGIDE